MSSEQANTQKKTSIHKSIASYLKSSKKEKAVNALFMCFFIVVASFAVLFENFTPFIYPLMGYIIFNERKYIKFLIFAVPGVIINTGIVGTARFALMFSLLIFALSLKRNILSDTALMFVCSILTSLSGIAASVILKQGFITTITMGAEGIICLCFYYIFKISINMFFIRKQKTVYSSNDLICFGLMLSCLTCGFSQLYIFKANAAFILSVFTILALGKLFTSACSVSYAVLSGCLLALSAGFDSAMISVLCISAIVSSIVSPLGMIVSCISFLLSISFGTLLLSSPANVIVNFYASLIACVAYIGVFKFMKFKKANQEHSGYEKIVAQSEAVSLIKNEIDTQKSMLHEISSALRDTNFIKQDSAVTYICKVVTGDICFSCARYEKCWSEESEETFEDLSSVINKWRCGNSSDLYFPKRLYEKCKNADLITQSIPYIYDGYTAKQTYSAKIDSFKELMKVRFDHMAGVLDRLYSKLSKGIYTYKTEAKHALGAMQNFGLNVENAVVFQDFDNRLRAIVRTKEILDEKQYKNTIPLILSKTLGRQFAAESNIQGDMLTYFYKQDYQYKLIVGAAGCSKHEDEPSGDNFSNVVFDNGLQMVALCDGMGSGENANRQSAKVLSLMEELMNAGCDETSAIETVNSVLTLCETEEMFSTIDLFLYDLQKGIGEFVKAGASPSYIKSDKEVTKISFESMPVGILDYVNIRKGLKSIKNGDYVFMMSDGFFRVFGDDDEYVRERLLAYEGRNPQKIAESLLEEALCVSDGKAPDDITIIVVKARCTK